MAEILSAESDLCDFCHPKLSRSVQVIPQVAVYNKLHG